jgi:hypothetical protein
MSPGQRSSGEHGRSGTVSTRAIPAWSARHVRLWLADWSLSRAQAARLLGTRLDGHKIVAVQWASPASNPDTPLPRSSLTLEQANCDLSVTLDYRHRHRR